jgi:hypothetical protein
MSWITNVVADGYLFMQTVVSDVSGFTLWVFYIPVTGYQARKSI